MARIFVALSGGVDSATSAALLKKDGHDVVGCFIKIWVPEFRECTWREDRIDAIRVAGALGIPYMELDLSEEYRSDVIESMVADYARGITPNPDVLCNSQIKFGAFAKWAFSQGADLIATGHYARRGDRAGKPVLLRGSDSSKDQSYFLWQVEPQTFARTLFPIGEIQKSNVRKLANEFSLPVAVKRDSQGLCFLGDLSMSEFLAHYLPLEEGDVVSESGETIGVHDGAALYTVGQRHGFRVMAAHGTGPFFVKRIDTARNMIEVVRDRQRATVPGVFLSSTASLPESTDQLEAQVRYREAAEPVFLEEKDHQPLVRFARSRLAAPGQSLVFYRGDEVVGGGVIERVLD